MGLSGSARSGADVEGLVKRNAAANQEKVHQAVAEAFKFVTYSPNKPTETADRLRKTNYANFPRSDK